MQHLRILLTRINGRRYPAYKNIKGFYQFRDFALDVDHVQGVWLMRVFARRFELACAINRLRSLVIQ